MLYLFQDHLLSHGTRSTLPPSTSNMCRDTLLLSKPWQGISSPFSTGVSRVELPKVTGSGQARIRSIPWIGQERATGSQKEILIIHKLALNDKERKAVVILKLLEIWEFLLGKI